ncbi:MAG: hypothetical protein QXN44_07580 [Candidatus Caldarchaeum sp.]
MILSTALATLLALAGTLMGVIRLMSYGLPVRLSEFFLLHPDLQAFGFLLLFILGVSYALIPRFKNKTQSNTTNFIIIVSTIFAGNLVKMLYDVRIGDFIILIACSAYAVWILIIVGKPAGFFWVSDSFIILSPVCLVAAAVLKIIYPYPWTVPRFLDLVLLGFPSAMVFGVVMRTVRFRLEANYRRKTAALCLVSFATAFVLIFSSELLRKLLLLLSGVLLLLAVDFHKVKTNVSGLAERDAVRYRYFTVVFTVAGLWLLAGLVFNFLQSLSSGFAFRDAYIHSIAIGFLGNMIMAYAPILLPPLISMKTPYKGLSLAPAILLNLGNSWRVAASASTGLAQAYLSGLLVLAGLAWFVVMVHRLR